MAINNTILTMPTMARFGDYSGWNVPRLRLSIPTRSGISRSDKRFVACLRLFASSPAALLPLLEIVMRSFGATLSGAIMSPPPQTGFSRRLLSIRPEAIDLLLDLGKACPCISTVWQPKAAS